MYNRPESKQKKRLGEKGDCILGTTFNHIFFNFPLELFLV